MEWKKRKEKKEKKRSLFTKLLNFLLPPPSLNTYSRGFTITFNRVCIIAGDVSPIDVLSHVPVLCEDNEVPYVFVPSKEVSQRRTGLALAGLGWAGLSRLRGEESNFYFVSAFYSQSLLLLLLLLLLLVF